MKIQAYIPIDFKGIKQVIQSNQGKGCWPTIYPQGWDKAKIKSEFEPINNYNNPIFLVAKAKEIITGLIVGHDLASFIKNEVPHLKSKLSGELLLEKCFYQRDIIIHSNFQGGTSAIRLSRALQEHALETGYTNIVTRTPPQNSQGINFFKKLGYEELFQDDKPERAYFIISLNSVNK